MTAPTFLLARTCRRTPPTIINWRAAALLMRHIGGVDELCVLPTSALTMARPRGNVVLPRRSFRAHQIVIIILLLLFFLFFLLLLQASDGPSIVLDEYVSAD